jgi:hypothetical protein
LDVERSTFDVFSLMSAGHNGCECDHDHNGEHDDHEERPTAGVANPAVIDLFALDSVSDEVLLVMNEERPWDDSDERLHEVQEKFNAYVSFVLDGEMLSEHPELAGKTTRIQLRCADMPGERGVELLGRIHDQLALQEIRMEVLVADNGGCGEGCACH